MPRLSQESADEAMRNLAGIAALVGLLAFVAVALLVVVLGDNDVRKSMIAPFGGFIVSLVTALLGVHMVSRDADKFRDVQARLHEANDRVDAARQAHVQSQERYCKAQEEHIARLMGLLERSRAGEIPRDGDEGRPAGTAAPSDERAAAGPAAAANDPADDSETAGSAAGTGEDGASPAC